MTISELLSPTRRGPAMARFLLPLAALSLVLSACAQGGPAAEPIDQETAVQSSAPEPSTTPLPTAAGTSASSPTASTEPSGTAEVPPAAAGTTAMLTISISQDPAAEPVQYVLECVDGAPGPASTLPNAEAACAALARLGTKFFTARPSKDAICTQQYGGPQTASITGELDGTSVLASFALTDGCEISRWDKVRDILGSPGGQ
ncbi:serine protease inhibitor [Arthrobacter sp. NamB2]|uniref:SSI family serine proteinase inhibitor n=1 Tax=Arthrobacter sp. NamB2 TaxID=2576035 RepID=UPI0010C93B74|nr:SSI family serine proteinase inhibitor [Arthrobacter sp. NamB2]TKV27348.1 serine protease inhibitor [Arthrobacter sp. NamB2]